MNIIRRLLVLRRNAQRQWVDDIALKADLPADMPEETKNVIPKASFMPSHISHYRRMFETKTRMRTEPDRAYADNYGFRIGGGAVLEDDSYAAARICPDDDLESIRRIDDQIRELKNNRKALLLQAFERGRRVTLDDIDPDWMQKKKQANKKLKEDRAKARKGKKA